MILMSVLVFSPTLSAGVITIDFESGVPEGWTTSGSVTVKKDNNSNRAALGGNATLTSPVIHGMTSVAYKHRGSGNNKELTVSVSTDGGASWEQIGSTKVSSSSSYGSSSHSVGKGTSADVMVRFTCLSATIYIDEIEINCVQSEAEPTNGASVALGTVTGSSAELTIAKGNGSGRLVAYCEGETLAWTPQDGVAYSGNFPKKVDGATIVASADVDGITIEGLAPGKAYTVAAFEYNGDGEARNYLIEPVAPLSFSTPTVPILSAPASLQFGNTKVGDTKVKAITIKGQYLDQTVGKVTVALSSDEFLVSVDNRTFGHVAELSYAEGVLDAVLYVSFTPGDYGESGTVIGISGGGAMAEIAVSGIGAERSNVDYFIAPDGNDADGDGTIEHPWLNLQKAVNIAQPGDVIMCRGGRYHFTQRDSSGKLTVRIKSSGTAEAPITIRAYGDEQPIFDFEQQLLDCKGDRSKVGDRGILLTGNHWYLYGLHITHAADNGIKLEGSHNRIERCEFSYNLDTGLQLGFGHDFSASGFGSKNDGSYCAYNDIIDCDSHHNCDYDTNYGSDADGFACKMHNGIGNRFIRCRAWRNGDDAWDLYETDFSVVLVECWAWESGKAEDHTWVYDYFDKGPSFSGNGNGIKLGGNGTGGSSKGVHYAYNCVAFGCNKSGSTKGFDCNSHKDGHVVIGGLAFDNGYDFMFESGGGANSEFYNNVCFGRQEILVGTESHNALLGMTPQQGKTFYNNVVTGFSRSDYESLAEADAIAPRGEDGSLPVKFARLRSGSKLVDAGIFKVLPDEKDFPFLSQPVYGDGRDIGPYELAEGPIHSSIQMIMAHGTTDGFTLRQSGVGCEYIAEVSVERNCRLSISVRDMSGRELRVVPLGDLEPGVVYTFPIRISDLPRGIYVASVSLPSGTKAMKLLR